MTQFLPVRQTIAREIDSWAFTLDDMEAFIAQARLAGLPGTTKIDFGSKHFGHAENPKNDPKHVSWWMVLTVSGQTTPPEDIDA